MLDMSDNSPVRDYFDKHAPRYDELLQSADFQLDDAYAYLADYLAQSWGESRRLRILELGTGTGKLTGVLLDRLASAELTGVDLSNSMLERARANLQRHSARVTLQCADFAQALVETKYDVVVSAIALTFYSLDHAALYRDINRWLVRGGQFVYAANVCQAAASSDASVAQMLSRRMALGREANAWLASLRAPEILLTPSAWHLAELGRAGFIDVDCVYLRYRLGIYSGRRPGIAIEPGKPALESA
jgi:tRNA (cmo5U34)-methyltransferase